MERALCKYDARIRRRSKRLRAEMQSEEPLGDEKTNSPNEIRAIGSPDSREQHGARANSRNIRIRVAGHDPVL
jgi:hypothetical protein